MPLRTLAACCFLSLCLTGCEALEPTLRMLVLHHKQFDPNVVAGIFSQQADIQLEPAIVPRGTTAIDAITSKQADLALVENSVAFVSGVRAVLPVFESVLHVAYRNGYRPSDIGNPLRGARFYIANDSTAATQFIQLVTRRAGLDASEYVIEGALRAGATDIIVYFGPINPEITDWLPQGYSLVSLDTRFNADSQFHREGVGYLAPNMKPRVIPPLTYDLPGNEEPLLTVAVDTLLVAHRDLSERQIYRLTQTLLEQKPRFVAAAPGLFNGMTESFDPLDLNFPLHAGARAYLNRDEPGLLERYAEVINMLVYVTFLTVTGLFALGRLRNRRKKDRIDGFYSRVISIRDRRTRDSSQALLMELDLLEREAFESLIAEKLLADESFRIFTELLGQLRDDLRQERAGAGQRVSAGAE
ncbi:MAG: TAXI family TRAP transporter solute-binding subunit [Pseudomonadota bacterium]